MEESELPKVVSVFENKAKEMHTFNSWDFIMMLEKNDVGRMWDKANYGEDIIIAKLDSRYIIQQIGSPKTISHGNTNPVRPNKHGLNVCGLNQRASPTTEAMGPFQQSGKVLVRTTPELESHAITVASTVALPWSAHMSLYVWVELLLQFLYVCAELLQLLQIHYQLRPLLFSTTQHKIISQLPPPILKVIGGKAPPRKLIRAKHFMKGYLSQGGKIPADMNSPPDFVDHGTHTLSTVERKMVPAASVFGMINGTTKGGVHLDPRVVDKESSQDKLRDSSHISHKEPAQLQLKSSSTSNSSSSIAPTQLNLSVQALTSTDLKRFINGDFNAIHKSIFSWSLTFHTSKSCSTYLESEFFCE
ncbi:hypothetical protein HYC85_017539 [Camellia sinensis]|uniref:Uncharacterized protein n=1 Tax=Camellia sinensis TaxID=4442 RepID=A0A7J7GRQ1_CAMSI|nr:hypothetical protein HYC85_017539 [Camellia sinensis]